MTSPVEKCPLMHSYYLKNSSNSNWVPQTSTPDPFIAFDAITGGLTIFTSDKALARIYYIKWRIEDLESLSDAPFAEVTFDLKIIHYCALNQITSSSPSLAS